MLLWAHRIARELGMLVDDLLDRCSAAEFSNWVAFLKLTREDFKTQRDVDSDIKSFFSQRNKDIREDVQ